MTNGQSGKNIRKFKFNHKFIKTKLEYLINEVVTVKDAISKRLKKFIFSKKQSNDVMMSEQNVVTDLFAS